MSRSQLSAMQLGIVGRCYRHTHRLQSKPEQSHQLVFTFWPSDLEVFRRTFSSSVRHLTPAGSAPSKQMWLNDLSLAIFWIFVLWMHEGCPFRCACRDPLAGMGCARVPGWRWQPLQLHAR